MNKASQIFSNLIIALISFYQRTISLDHSMFKARHPFGFCRFYPSCSEYTRQAVLRHGAVRGLWKGFKRVLRCNPLTKPTVDPIDAD